MSLGFISWGLGTMTERLIENWISIIKKLINYIKQKPKQLDDLNSFFVSATCRTCSNNQSLRIPLGKTGIEYAHKIKCHKCQNKTWRIIVY